MAFGDIGKVYSTLIANPNWKKDVDANNDGIIIKAELANYLEGCEWTVETPKYEREDLIDKFWKMFDVHRLMDKLPGTDIANFNALDAQEESNMETDVISYADCRVKYDNLVKSITTPTGLNEKYSNFWKDDVILELNNYFNELFFSGTKNPNEMDNKLKEKYDVIKYSYSVDYYALQDLELTYQSKYPYSDELKFIIYAAVDEIKTEGRKPSVVYTEYKKAIEQAIRDYLDMLPLTDPLEDEPDYKVEDVEETPVEPVYETSWNVSGMPAYLVSDQAVDINISANVTKDGKNVETGSITYQTSDPNVEFKDGKIKIIAPSNSNNYNLTVYAIVDGKQVGSYNINLEVFKNTNKIKDEDATINITQRPREENYQSKRDSQKTSRLLKFKDHITKATKFCSKSDFSYLKTQAKNSVTQIIYSFADILISKGYNTNQVNYAKNTMINYYSAAINSLTDIVTDSKDSAYGNKYISYKDSNGDTISENMSYLQQTYYRESTVIDIDYNDIQQLNQTNSGIFLGESNSKPHTYIIYFNTGIVLNNFIKFMDKYLEKKNQNNTQNNG